MSLHLPSPGAPSLRFHGKHPADAGGFCVHPMNAAHKAFPLPGQYFPGRSLYQAMLCLLRPELRRLPPAMVFQVGGSIVRQYLILTISFFGRIIAPCILDNATLYFPPE